MTTPPEETQPPRRGRAAPVGSDAGTTAAKTFARMGFTDPALVLHWHEIAGPEVARLCQPLRFSEGPQGGVLTLKALPGAALFLGHETRALTARINRYLGRPAVARLKLIQGSFIPHRPPPALRRPAVGTGCGDPANSWRGPDSLKAALLALARWRESGKN
ncbi:MAG: DUF721 domain-containing protein [Alphaproteobacteria bacterium]|nr:DUF721 domain-containing protein [Alphaproteobacteria bacterium]